ncbi:MAG: hypothetical protein JWN46_1188 [Acidimicrobiales bacterium]|nr:hypothetical protein [Acidimicrobiales bacterium]
MDHEPRWSAGLPVARSYVVDTDRLRAVVVEVDATGDPPALQVLQAGLHEPPEGSRLVFGYDVSASGLGAWVGDRRLRLEVWPALVDDAGEVHEEDPDEGERDVLAIDFDPAADADALRSIGHIGRIVIAGPDAGPTPLVLDIDRDLWQSVATDAGLA